MAPVTDSQERSALDANQSLKDDLHPVLTMNDSIDPFAVAVLEAFTDECSNPRADNA